MAFKMIFYRNRPKKTRGTFEIRYDAQDAKRLLFGLLALEVFFVAVYVVLQIVLSQFRWGPLSLFFDLNHDLSLPAWFSTLQLFAASVMAFVVARHIQRYRWFIVLSGFLLLFLSADEGARIHERITEFAFRHDIGFLQLLTINNHGAWIVPYLALGTGMFAVCIKPIIFFFNNYRIPSLVIGAGAAALVSGAAGLEVISYLFLREGPEVWFKIEVAAEEFLEMAGVSLVFYGILIFGIEVNSEAKASLADHMHPV